MQGWRGCLIGLGLALAVAACGPPDPLTYADNPIAAAAPGDWVSYGRTYDEQRSSPLDKIHAGHIGRRGLTWYADLDTSRGQEATPLVRDETIYISTAWSKVKAYDAKPGELKWAYDPKVPGEWAAKACCDVVNRGVALWKDRVYVGTLD